MNSSVKIFAAGALSVIISIFAAFYFHWEDVHTYYTSARSLLAGRIDLYAPDFGDSQIMDYRYPPFFLFLFAPLVLLPYTLVKFIWLWLNIIAIYLSAIAVRRSFELTAEKTVRLKLALFLAFLVSIKYFLMLFQHFNAHLIIVALMFGAFYLLLRLKWAWAAGLTALAISVKIVPVLLLPYFFIKKQWNFLAATALLVIVFNLLPALYFGANLNFKLLGDWHRHVVVNNEFHDTNGPINLSLKGQLERLLTETDYSLRVEDPEYANVNLFALPKKTAEYAWMIIGAAMFAATMFLIWRAQRRRAKINRLPGSSPPLFDRLAPHEFGLMICLMLLVAPRSNGYYLTAMFFPLAVLIHSIFRRKSKFDIFGLSLIITATLLLPLVPGRLEQRYLLVFGIDFYAVLILWAVLAYDLYRESFAEKTFSRQTEPALNES